MATREVVDRQYLWILPKYLELTSETKRLAREYIEEGANEDLAFAYYIYTLVNPTSGFMYDASDQDEVQLRKHHALEDLMVHDPLSVFVYREKCLQAFRWIGLDIRGGFANIDRLIRYSKTGFGTASILVTDAEKARKYANIGVHVDAMSLMHEYPKTFEEAVKNYALLLELTKENFRTPRKIDQEIEDLLPFVCTERDEIVWGLRREKFVLKVRDQYREVVAEMAMEEKLSALHTKFKTRNSKDLVLLERERNTCLEVPGKRTAKSTESAYFLHR